MDWLDCSAEAAVCSIPAAASSETDAILEMESFMISLLFIMRFKSFWMVVILPDISSIYSLISEKLSPVLLMDADPFIICLYPSFRFSATSSVSLRTLLTILLISTTELETCSASFLTSSATTANPLPCSLLWQLQSLR